MENVWRLFVRSDISGVIKLCASKNKLSDYLHIQIFHFDFIFHVPSFFNPEYYMKVALSHI